MNPSLATQPATRPVADRVPHSGTTRQTGGPLESLHEHADHLAALDAVMRTARVRAGELRQEAFDAAWSRLLRRFASFRPAAGRPATGRLAAGRPGSRPLRAWRIGRIASSAGVPQRPLSPEA